MEQSVIVLRPMVTKTGLNKVFEKIIQVNNFYILKKEKRALKPAEATILGKLEGMKGEKLDFYRKIVLEGLVEIYLVSKFGAVGEAKALANGCMRGRRRVSQQNEDQQDSV